MFLIYRLFNLLQVEIWDGDWELPNVPIVRNLQGIVQHFRLKEDLEVVESPPREHPELLQNPPLTSPVIETSPQFEQFDQIEAANQTSESIKEDNEQNE